MNWYVSISIITLFILFFVSTLYAKKELIEKQEKIINYIEKIFFLTLIFLPYIINGFRYKFFNEKNVVIKSSIFNLTLVIMFILVILLFLLKQNSIEKMDGKFKNFIYYFFYFIISIADIIAFFIINIFKI